jgi:septum site-determining protein MinD
VGKTTLTANLSAALAKRGKSVLAVDGDMGLRNLDIILGLSDKVVYDAADAAKGICPAGKAILPCPAFPGLHFLAAPQADDKRILPEEMKRLINGLREHYGFILVDCPAGVGASFETGIAGADRAIVVATPDLPSIRDADKTALLLEKNGIRRIDLVVNRVRPDLIRKKVMPNMDAVIDAVSLGILGVILEDERILRCASEGGVMVSPKAAAPTEFDNIAARLCGDMVPVCEMFPKRTVMNRLLGTDL